MLPPHTPDLDNGQVMFDIGGCASCHATPNADSAKIVRTELGGGLALPSPFGTFYVPNISPDLADGIGAWSEADFVTALWKGTSPRGRHLFPAFPYPSLQHMELADVRDLFAYLKTLPPVPGRVRRHDLAFPFNIRRLVGLWKLLFLHGRPYTPDPGQSAQLNRGAYLVNGPGHCAECHSPRNFLGAIIDSERFAGGPAADGKSWVPNITPAGLRRSADDHVAWSQKDMASYLADGFDPERRLRRRRDGRRHSQYVFVAGRRPCRHRRLCRFAAAPARPETSWQEMIKITCEAGSARHYLITEWGRYGPPKALNVIIVRVSCTPAMVCTFSAMKWPMSVVWST